MSGHLIGVRLTAALFALLAVNAWSQVILVVAGRNDDPLPLTLLQLAAGSAACAASVGSWRARPWSAGAALGWGIVTAVLVLALDPLLDLGAEARNGLRLGALVVLGIGGGCAWYLRRATARLGRSSAGAPRPHPPPAGRA